MLKYEIYQSDVLDKTKEFEDNTFDAIFCDPPYGMNFMNKRWDKGVPSTEIWVEILRVCKPGAWLMSFGGTRLFHRLAVNIEDAGWEIKDTLMWVYGSGFPKSYNISKGIDKKLGGERKVVGESTTRIQLKSHDDIYGGWKGKEKTEDGGVPITAPATNEAKQWDGYGTALKPAWEPIILARKPLDGTNVNNVLKWGCGGLNIDSCRIKTNETITNHSRSSQSAISKGRYGDSSAQSTHQTAGQAQGRFPANFIHDGSNEVVGLFPKTNGGKYKIGSNRLPRHEREQYGDMEQSHIGIDNYGDSGSAARFFYTAKVSKKERNAGLDGIEDSVMARSGGAQQAEKEGKDEYKQEHIGLNRIIKVKNNHPTLKPISLCEYLAKLILPPERETSRKLLVPFCGTGSEIAGALNAGWDEVYGIDLEEQYCEIAKLRIPALVNNEKQTINEDDTLSLFF